MALTLVAGDTNPGLAISTRGYHATFRADATNLCPGCGRSHWHVGRFSAECGFCATALPFAGSGYAAAGAGRRL